MVKPFNVTRVAAVNSGRLPVKWRQFTSHTLPGPEIYGAYSTCQRGPCHLFSPINTADL